MTTPIEKFSIPLLPLLLLLIGCSDESSVGLAIPSDPLLARFWSEVQDVPAVEMGLPSEPRPWDADLSALAVKLAQEDGHAMIALKEPSSLRVLQRSGPRGIRAAVGASAIKDGLELLTAERVEILAYLKHIGAARVKIDPAVAVNLARHPLIDYIEPRLWARLFSSYRPGFASASALAEVTPWGISAVRAPEAWTKTRGWGAKMLVIDSGHEQGHEDLPPVSSSNCGGSFDGCADDSGAGWHGTHVLGIAAARDNSVGVIGVAPGLADVNVYVWGACDPSTGLCDEDAAAAGIDQGVSWGVDVINMSFGGSETHVGMANAIGAANDAGIVLIASAGNHCHVVGCPPNDDLFPANDTKVLGVSGINSDQSFAHPSNRSWCEFGFGERWSSNFGIHVDLSAPFDANSTIGGNDYGLNCGASMATPHVSAVVALIHDIAPNLTPLKVWQRLFETATDLGPAGWDQEFGMGLVNAYAAVGPHASIDGPTRIPAATSCEWLARWYGGYGSPVFEWYKDGVLVATTRNYITSASATFHLELRVIDEQNVMDSDHFWVEIDNTAECVA